MVRGDPRLVGVAGSAFQNKWLCGHKEGSTTLPCKFIEGPQLPGNHGPSDGVYHLKRKKKKKANYLCKFSVFSSPPHHQRILIDPRHQEELSQLSCHLLSDIKSMAPPEFLRLSGGPWRRGPVAKIPSHIINKLKKEKLLLRSFPS